MFLDFFLRIAFFKLAFTGRDVPLDVGEVIILSAINENYALMRQGNTPYMAPKRNYFDQKLFSVVPTQIVPAPGNQNRAAINIAGQYLCQANENGDLRTCLESQKSAWRFLKPSADSVTYSVVDDNTKKCLTVGGKVPGLDVYTVREENCDNKKKAQQFHGIKVSSKSTKNIVFLDESGNEITAPKLAN